jgi:hypothetical protein
MSAQGLAAFVITALLALPAVASADVQLTFENGLVTLNARNATVREILAEWARVGKLRILNGERVPGGPITIQLTNVPEARALEIVLRSVSGYMAAPRRVAADGTSRFERILVLPTSSAPRQVASTPAPPMRQPSSFPGTFNPQFNPPFPQPGDFPVDDDQDAPRPVNVIPNPGAPGANFQQPQSDAPPPPAQHQQFYQSAPGLAPGGVPPAGVAAPGMIVPAPRPGPGNQPGAGQPPAPPNTPPNGPQ